MKKNLKNLEKKLKNLKIILQAFGLKENDKDLIKSFSKKIKSLEKDQNIINYKVLQKKPQISSNNFFDLIEEELCEYNFDYISSFNKSINNNLNENKDNKAFDKKFNHFYAEFDKDQLKNIKIPLKKKFINRFKYKKQVLDKNEQNINNIFDDAFNEFI